MSLAFRTFPFPGRSSSPAPLVFTPAECRWLLEDPGFLTDPDNSYRVPRRLMGLPVRIVPDHGVEFVAMARRERVEDPPSSATDEV